MDTTTDPILDLAKAFVWDAIQKMQGADANDIEEQITSIAKLIIGPHEAALTEYAAVVREQIELQRAQLPVQKRDSEAECDAGIAKIEQALSILTPPIG